MATSRLPQLHALAKTSRLKFFNYTRADDNGRYLLETRSTTSRIPTYHFQASLPRLPIPSLQDTISRYLAAQRPFLNRERFRRTVRAAREFTKEGSEGWRLHRELMERDSREQHTSYVAKYWHERFMRNRSPLPLIGLSYSFGMKHDLKELSQIERAVNIIRSVVRYKNSLIDEKLEPDVVYSGSRISPEVLKQLLCRVPSRFSTRVASLAGAVPLNMSQHKHILGTTRVPRKGCDKLAYSLSSQHIVVMRRGHLYSVNVQLDNGLPVPADQLYSDLLAIVQDPSPSSSHSVSYLTATNRDSWADAREEMISNVHNARALEKIESALFVVCLDDHQPDSETNRYCTFLHNYGVNRWFDKSLQIVVTPNAEAGVVLEHSWGDATTVASFVDKIYHDSLSSPRIPSFGAGNINQLRFHLTDSLKQAIDCARVDIEDKCQLCSFKQFNSGYDKNFWKQNGVSPNGGLQLALQIAYYRLYGRFDPTFQPCSTRSFLDGRTEWLRPGTMAAMACAKAMEPSSGVSAADKVHLLKKAIAELALLAKQANIGQGFDRHLYSLKCMAEEKSLSLSLFEDPAYSDLNHLVLYSSTLDGGSFSFVFGGPVQKDGTAISFSWEDGVLAILMTGLSAEKVNSFATSFTTVLEDIRKLILSSGLSC